MEEQKYYFKISPENIKGDILYGDFTGSTDISHVIDPCCPITATTITKITGTTGYYLPLQYVLSGGTNGESLLNCVSIPLLFTENTVDLGYYTPFDGAVLQKDTIVNFLWSGNTLAPYDVAFYNTSDESFIKFLSLCTYVVDWGDGSPIVTLTSQTPITHTYVSTPTDYVIKMTCYSPWGISFVEKPIKLPFTGVTINNPQGTANFQPAGCYWSGTPISYDYIFSGDSNYLLSDYDSSTYTTTPFLITGYTKSSLYDLTQYGPKYNLYNGKFRLNIQVTGTSGCVGMVYGPNPTNEYTAYTVNNILYWDLNDGTTLYFVSSEGIKQDDYVLSAITKDEALLNIIDEPQIQSNIFVERGKMSPIETIERMGEIDNLGDLIKYGYGFFKIKKT